MNYINEYIISSNRYMVSAKNTLKKILLYMVIELLIITLTLPLAVFYGPFQNVKKTVVGMSVNSFRHGYIARFFLSDNAIRDILGTKEGKGQFGYDEEIKVFKFGKSHTEKIVLYNITGNMMKGKMLVISNPLSIKTGYSAKMPESGETTGSIARRNKAAAAINAGGFMDAGWAGTGGAPTGFIIHKGKVVYDQKKNRNLRQDAVAFTSNGMLIVGKHSISQLEKYNVMEAVSFGPPLIVNGKPTIKDGDGGWGIAPRTAIGQRRDGAVIFIVIDGRDILHSYGATLKEVQDILLKNGAVNAANLDGGSSTTMYFNGKVINRPSNIMGERTVPSVFMTVPAMGM